MREFIYRWLIILPAKIAGVVGWIAGILSAAFPSKLERVSGQVVNAETIRTAGIALLAVTAAYFALLWLLKPARKALGGNGDMHIHNYYAPLSDLTGTSKPGSEARNKIFPPAVTQTKAQARDDALAVPEVLFPFGLYVGIVIVSAAKLMNELNSLEIAIRAFNGTGKALRLAYVNGAIAGSADNQDSVELPAPVWKTEHTSSPIEPYTEFMVVIEQRLSPASAELYRKAMEENQVMLDLRSLNVNMELADNPADRARLPLWDGVTIRRRDDVFTGRVFMASINFPMDSEADLDPT